MANSLKPRTTKELSQLIEESKKARPMTEILDDLLNKVHGGARN